MKYQWSFFVVGTLAASLVGCSPSSENVTAPPATNQTTAQDIGNGLSNAWDKTKETATNAWDSVKGTFQSASDYTYDHKDAYLARIRAEMDELDQKIKDWSDKAANAADSAKVDAQAKLEDLRAQRSKLDDKYQAVKDSTADNWNDVKAGFENAYDNVTNSVSQAWQWLKDKVNS